MSRMCAEVNGERICARDANAGGEGDGSRI